MQRSPCQRGAHFHRDPAGRAEENGEACLDHGPGPRLWLARLASHLPPTFPTAAARPSEFEAVEAKLLRVAVGWFMEMASLSLETMDAFDEAQ